jgi:CHAD domain-containing protein
MIPRNSAHGMESASVRDRLADWRELLDRCGRKPTRKRVHALRVVTLRLQAELDRDAGELPSASHQAQAVFQFGKHAQRLRRVLGRVREIDVWIGMLGRLRTSMSATTEYVPRTTRECIRQIERTEERLKGKRGALERRLMAEIENRRVQLESAGKDVDQAVGIRRGAPESQAFEQILARFASVAAEFPMLDEENLHEFRKRIKTVRYLAEISGEDPACSRLAAQMKKMQTAIGDWHDWQALAQEVSRGRRKRGSTLAELLDSMRSEAFDAAIASCHAVTARLLAKKVSSNGAGSATLRKLPASELAAISSLERKLA